MSFLKRFFSFKYFIEFRKYLCETLDFIDFSVWDFFLYIFFQLQAIETDVVLLVKMTGEECIIVLNPTI